jgi:cell division septation protein DedD
MLIKLRNKGFIGFIPTLKYNEIPFKVQVGAFRDRKKAEDLLGKLKAQGFEGFIKED